MSNSFGRAFRYFRASGGARTPGRILGAVIFAALAVGATRFLPQYVTALSGKIPEFLTGGLAGTVYAYAVLTAACLLLYRCFAGKLFTYGDVTDGHCYFALGCGAKASSLLWAKYLSGMFASAFTYVLGAALTFGACYLLLPGLAGWQDALPIALAGLFLILIVQSVQLIIGALGGNRGLVAAVGLAFLFLGFAYLYIKGFFALRRGSDLLAAAKELGSFALTGLAIPAVVLTVLAAVICLTVPRPRLRRYEVEDLDTDMLKNLGFQKEFEVYEKQEGDEYELLFAGKDVLGD